MTKNIIEYVWLEAISDDNTLKYKSTTRIVDDIFTIKYNPYLVTINDKEILLTPYVVTRDPFRDPSKDYLIFCYLCNKDDTRQQCIDSIKAICTETNPILSLIFTQNITIVNNNFSRIGFAYSTLAIQDKCKIKEISYHANSCYNNKSKKIIDEILNNCIIADININGYTMNDCPSSYSFQIGSNSIISCDDLIIFRYIALRTVDLHDLYIIFGNFTVPVIDPCVGNHFVKQTNSGLKITISHTLNQLNLFQQMNKKHILHIEQTMCYSCDVNPYLLFNTMNTINAYMIPDINRCCISKLDKFSKNFEVLQHNFRKPFDDQIIIINENKFIDNRHFSDANPYLILIHLLECVNEIK